MCKLAKQLDFHLSNFALVSLVDCYIIFGLRFFRAYSITLTPEEGNGSVELVTNGRNIQVNEVNVYDYVRFYANYRLIKTHEKSLEVRVFSICE